MTAWFSRRSQAMTGNSTIDRYLQLDFEVDKNQSIHELGFIVLDCEMTGLGPNSQLVSLGAIPVKGNCIDTARMLDLRFDFSQANATSEIHGELPGGRPVTGPEAIGEILTFLDNNIVIGHSVSLDIRQLNQLLLQGHPQLKIRNKVLDTYHLMRRLDPTRFDRMVAGQESLRLDALCRELNVPIENRHTALGDAYLTAQVFLKILSRLHHRKVTKAGQLLKR